jgi:acyl carrier protein
MSDFGNEIDTKLKSLLKKIFEIDDVDLTLSMDDIPEWDSFKHFELIVNLEKEFKIKLAVSDTTEITSIPIIKTKILKYLDEK